MQLSKNTIIISILSFAAILGFLAIVYMATSNTGSADTTVYTDINKVVADDHVKWAKNGSHTLIEYGDLQCPSCKAYHDFISSAIEKPQKGQVDVTKKIKFVFREYPLIGVHEWTLQAASAAEAAAKQGKFFEMADLMFNNQDSWSTSDPTKTFEGYAKDLGLNIDQFKKDRDSQAVKDRINRDITSGNQAHVNATPTFFLDGKKLDVRSLVEFQQALEAVAK